MFVGSHTLFLKIVFTSDTIWTFSITWYFKVYTIYVVTLLNECNFNKKSSESEGIFQMLLRMADQKQMRPISNIQIKTVKWFAHNCISYLQFQFPVFNFSVRYSVWRVSYKIMIWNQVVLGAVKVLAEHGFGLPGVPPHSPPKNEQKWAFSRKSRVGTTHL